MNEHEQFTPAWAEKTLGPKNDAGLELRMLWAFYDAWEALHAIAGDKRNPEIRAKYESAAQELVEAAQPVRLLRKHHGN